MPSKSKGSSKSLVYPDFPPFVEILGTPWRIKTLTASEEPDFEKESCFGFCTHNEKLIKLLIVSTVDYFKNESKECCDDIMRETLRHEIVHAFLYESGLGDDSVTVRNKGWAKNEEMVDWFANQGPKIYMAWEKCNCLSIMNPDVWIEWNNWKKQQEESKC